MVIKGTSCAGAGRLAIHLTRTDQNEKVDVIEIRGVGADSLQDALLEMEITASGSRATKPFYHASINTLPQERMTDEQRAQAIDRLEAELGLTDQPRIVVVHEKDGREHCHVVWSRIDLDRMTAISDSHNYRKHELVARELEREFGFQRTQGVHVEREGKPRPARTPSHAEMLQAQRTGISPQQVKDQVTEVWRGTDSGQDFAKALDQSGYILARGDRRDFVVIDPKGGIHSLSRRIEGARAADVRERMADIDVSRLPSVAEAKQLQRDRHSRAELRERENPDVDREPRTDRVSPKPAPTVEANRGRNFDTPERPGAHARAADGFGRAASAMLDGLASLFERGLSGGAAQADQAKPEPEPEHDRRETHHETALRQDEEQRSARRQEYLRKFALDRQDELAAERNTERERGRSR